MRVESNGTRYFSFQELASAYNIEPKSKVNKDINVQREKFASHHKCKACGEPMTFVGTTNTMVCRNPKCKGIKNEHKDKDGNTVITYLPSYDLLEEKWANVASKLFD